MKYCKSDWNSEIAIIHGGKTKKKIEGGWGREPITSCRALLWDYLIPFNNPFWEAVNLILLRMKKLKP